MFPCILISNETGNKYLFQGVGTAQRVYDDGTLGPMSATLARRRAHWEIGELKYDPTQQGDLDEDI
jgi:hypothetical protein